jgi:DNA-binding Xre family transcriptional regulator
MYIQIKVVTAAKKQAWGRKIPLNELAEATAIRRMTISRMENNHGFSTVTDHLDQLYAYFDCQLHAFMCQTINLFNSLKLIRKIKES